MKNFLFSLVAIVAFSFVGSANNVVDHSKDPKEVKIEYSIGDKKVSVSKVSNNEKELEVFTNNELEKMSQKLNTVEDDELTCSATIHVGVPSNYIEVTVSGPCSEMAAIIKRVKKEISALL